MGTHIIYTAAVHNNKMGTVSLNICIHFGDTFTFIKDIFCTYKNASKLIVIQAAYLKSKIALHKLCLCVSIMCAPKWGPSIEIFVNNLGTRLAVDYDHP